MDISTMDENICLNCGHSIGEHFIGLCSQKCNYKNCKCRYFKIITKFK